MAGNNQEAGSMSSVPIIDDTTHGAVRWLRDQGPVPVSLYLGDCKHWGQSVIAYGWDLKHYELVVCDLHEDGTSGCGSRAWSNERSQITTTWMHPAG
jgi:hypothetical protein